MAGDAYRCGHVAGRMSVERGRIAGVDVVICARRLYPTDRPAQAAFMVGFVDGQRERLQRSPNSG